MVSCRAVSESDRPVLEAALAKDVFHPGVQADVFYEPGTVANMYSDSEGPVLFVRGYKSLHIDLLCVDNSDAARNRAVMQSDFKVIESNARAAGFKEIITSVNGLALLKFVCRPEDKGGLGFERTEVNGEIALRKVL